MIPPSPPLVRVFRRTSGMCRGVRKTCARRYNRRSIRIEQRTVEPEQINQIGNNLDSLTARAAELRRYL